MTPTKWYKITCHKCNMKVRGWEIRYFTGDDSIFKSDEIVQQLDLETRMFVKTPLEQGGSRPYSWSSGIRSLFSNALQNCLQPFLIVVLGQWRIQGQYPPDKEHIATVGHRRSARLAFRAARIANLPIQPPTGTQGMAKPFRKRKQKGGMQQAIVQPPFWFRPEINCSVDKGERKNKEIKKTCSKSGTAN